MGIEFELLGFDEIINQVQGLVDSSELYSLNEKIVTTVTENVKEEIRPKIPKSEDNSKSGKKGYRPHGHFADNIPQSSIKKSKEGLYIVLGEENEEGEYFYWTFKEFGTSKMPPTPVFGQAREMAQKMLEDLGVEEYSRLLQRKLGGD